MDAEEHRLSRAYRHTALSFWWPNQQHFHIALCAGLAETEIFQWLARGDAYATALLFGCQGGVFFYG
jgi:hypothetical protein